MPLLACLLWIVFDKARAWVYSLSCSYWIELTEFLISVYNLHCQLVESFDCICVCTQEIITIASVYSTAPFMVAWSYWANMLEQSVSTKTSNANKSLENYPGLCCLQDTSQWWSFWFLLVPKKFARLFCDRWYTCKRPCLSISSRALVRG